MLFGNTNTFAVEIYHEPKSPEWKGFGRMCIHVQGSTIGNIKEAHCSLFHAVDAIVTSAESLSDLWDLRFEGHTAEEIFSWLDAIIYSGDIEPGQAEIEKFEFLTNSGEQFDALKCFIYCAPDNTVYIPYQKNGEKIKVSKCLANEFYYTASELKQWFQMQVAA